MLYIYKTSNSKIVKTYKTERDFQRSKYADWGEGDWNDAGLAVCNESSAAQGCTDGLHY